MEEIFYAFCSSSHTFYYSSSIDLTHVPILPLADLFLLALSAGFNQVTMTSR